MSTKQVNAFVKGSMFLLLASSLVLVSGCEDKDSGDTGNSGSSEVVVNNGQVDSGGQDTSGEEVKDTDSGSNSDSEEGGSTPERTIVQDKVPKVTGSTAVRGTSEVEDSSGGEGYPDMSEDYVQVDSSGDSPVSFDIPYTLYYKDSSDRAVGGEGVVLQGKPTTIPEKVGGESGELHSLQLIPSTLIEDDKGLEDRNYVKVTRQAHDLMTELHQNVYKVVTETQEDNHVYISVEALYVGEDKIPYGIEYRAQSVRGDIKFHYIVHNIQEGATVNYSDGTVKFGDVDE